VGADPDAAASRTDTLAALILALRSKQLSPVEVAETALRRADDVADLNAFRWIDGDRLIEAARRTGPRRGSLWGVPIALKDNIDTAGIPTTSGSMVDIDRVPTRDATIWRRLRDDAGALLLGKAHLSEFAYRAHHPRLGPVRNPRDRTRATGGSSSGSAAAVAARVVPVAIGTDTGGSVRIPAAYCGIVGFKGSSGCAETDGIVPLSVTMDHPGVLAGSVRDAAIAFEAMARRVFPLVDPTTLEVLPMRRRGLRIGIETGYYGQTAETGVMRGLGRATSAFETIGCRLVEIRLPLLRRWRAAHRTIILSEAWDFHRDRLQGGAPYGPVFRTAVESGGRITPRRRREAGLTRSSAIESLGATFQEIDLLLTPTCPTVAPPIDEGVRHTRYTRFTTLAAFAGLPAISIPAGAGRHGLPVGVQLMGPHGGDRLVISAAAALEAALGPGPR
jgi:aspartyl-tRNA(Asn)/glutamyl-tRNA(Gln) amidotransferase subunit A